MSVVARIDSLIAALQGLRQCAATARGTQVEVELVRALDQANGDFLVLASLLRLRSATLGRPMLQAHAGVAPAQIPSGRGLS